MKTATIIEWPNIMRPREGELIHQVEAGQTLHQWLTDTVPGYSQDLERQPVECIVSGKPVSPDLWPSLVLRENVPVVLAVRPFGWESAFYYLFVAVAAAAVAINMMPPPPSESVLPDASPTYDTNAQGNQARLMNPIPFAVGYNRHWMDMLTEPWREYEGNDQYLYQLFCVGWGEFDLEPLQIGDTEYSKYQDIKYDVYGPNDKVTLFPDNVDTSEEIGGIELFGPNEAEYQDWSGPYVLVKKAQKANFLACDFACRQGIYHFDDDGDMRGRTAQIEIQYQSIDDKDKPTGNWQSVKKSYSGATNTPQRWSHRWEVAPGRYHVRVKRINSAGTDSKTKDSIHWESARAYYPSKQEYPGVTKIAVRIRASNNLSQQSEKRFNIRGTALSPEWTGNGWSQSTKNREIAWAFCNAIKSAHGGRLSDDLIDFENVLSLHQAWKNAGETVSRVFDTLGTLRGSLQEIVAAGRGTVLTHNGRFYVVRDMQRLLRRHMYTPFMMASAPSVERSFPQAGDNDSIIVEFYNQEIWENDEILCQLPNHPANNPKRITLRSVPNREHAYRIGIFECAKMLYRRMQISFTTEMQALNSLWGDKIGVSYWLRGWGESGEVVAFDGLRATLSDDVELHPTKQNLIALCRPDGTMSGPYKIESAGTNKVLLSEKPDFDIYTGDMMSRTQYQIGTDGAFCKDFLVTEISPAADGQVSVKAVWDNPKVYTFESLPVPPKGGAGDNLPREVKPVISKLVIYQDVTDPQSATLSWQSTAGAREFIIEHSLDGAEFARVAVTTINTWSTRLYNGDNWFRVAGVADAQGDWEQGYIKLTGKHFDKPPATTIKLTEPFTGPVLKVEWEPVLSADHYTVEVVKSGNAIYTVKQYQATEWEYSAEQGLNHGSGRAFTVRVTPYNAKGIPGEPATLNVRNEPPAVPNNISINPFVDGFSVTCDASTAPDLRDLRIWGSKTKGFKASADNMLQISQSTQIYLNIKGSWYFRLAWSDVWGAKELNLSGEFSGKTADIDMSEIEGDLKDLTDQLNKKIDQVSTNVDANRNNLNQFEQETKNNLDGVRNDLKGLDTGIKTVDENSIERDNALSKRVQTVSASLEPVIKLQKNPDFSLKGKYWSRSYQGETVPENLDGSWSTSVTVDGGVSYWVRGKEQIIYSANAIPVDVNRKYRVRFRVRQWQDPTDKNRNIVKAGVICLDSGYNAVNGGSTSPRRYCAVDNRHLQKSEGWQVFSGIISGVDSSKHDNNKFSASNVRYIRICAYVNFEKGNGETLIDLLDFEDVTDVQAVKAMVQEEKEARVAEDKAQAKKTEQVAADLSTETKNRTAAVKQVSDASVKRDDVLSERITTVSSELSDETAARVAAIKKQESARNTLEQSLTQQINTVQSGYKAADKNLQSAITNETKARNTAIDSLASDVKKVTADYKAADKSLQGHINNEATTRATETGALGRRVDDVNASLGPIVQLQENPDFSLRGKYWSKSSVGKIVPENLSNSWASPEYAVTGNTSYWAKGEQFIYSANAIPVDVNRKYKVRFRVRQHRAATSGESRIFAGVACLGGSYESINGKSKQFRRYCAIAGSTLPSRGKWYLYEGVITGVGETENSFSSSAVKFIRLCAVVNYKAGNGEALIDLLDFEDVTDQEEIKATIQTKTEALAEKDKALSSEIKTVQAAVGKNTASVQQHTTAIAKVENGVTKLETSWGVKMESNGYCSGFVMNNDGKNSSALFRVGTFAIGEPGKTSLTFAVKGNRVVLPGVSIEDGGITASKINVTNLAAISGNMGTLTAGTMKTDAATGARVELSSSGNYPLWIGSGSKTAANGQLYYDKGKKQLYTKNMQATNLKCTTGDFKDINVSGFIQGSYIDRGQRTFWSNQD